MAAAPLSFAQERLWFLNQVEGLSAAYNSPEVFRLSGPLDAGALESAFRDVVARHEILRTVFPVVNGHPCQQVLSPDHGNPVLERAELSEQDAQEAVAKAAARDFDLTVDLPVRVWLFAVAPEEHVLLVVLHHIAWDAWSAEPLWGDLAQAYEARLAGTEPHWSPLPVQYSGYAVWQRALLGDADDPASMMSRELAYWRDQLAGLPTELRLPTDRTRPPVASSVVGTVPLQLEAGLHGKLEELARESEATMFMVVHAAVAALLTRLGAGTDLPVGTMVADRGDDALNDLVGFFVNVLVLRANTAGDPSFRALLARIRDTDLAAFEHRELPFDKVVHALNPERSVDRNPLYQVSIAFYDGLENVLRLKDVVARHESLDTNTGRLDLIVDLNEKRAESGGPGGIEGTLAFAVDLFDHETATLIARDLVLLLEAVAAAPDAPISQADLQFPADRLQAAANQKVADPAPAPPRATPPSAARSALEQTLHGLFAEVLKRTEIQDDDDFFLLGGHSLAATRLISRIRSVLGVRLKVGEFFAEPTVAGVARRIGDASRPDPLPSISRRARS
ncbi:MAG TPA: condensation domain-containing protein [Pseudonocardiaceae bacterium]|nr:condensation domain-containing protein [Pseudonocardiaceae bacterium]